MPHGHCYLWKPGLLWLQVVSNGLIGLAYLAISLTLAYLVFRVRDIPFRRMYLAFGVFIVACGVTHFFDIYVIWTPAYWVDGSIRAVTAVASIGTALMLPPLVPKAVAIARGAKAAHDRGMRLETMVRDLETMYARTRELEAMKTHFFANVSHELRTPLALILGPVDKLLADDKLPSAAKRDLEVVAHNARTLLKHVGDLLDIAKLDEGKLQVRYVGTDLARLVRLVSSNFESVADERRITLQVVTPTMVAAELDTDKLQRVLLNLLSNAFKATPDGGRIRCQLETDGDLAILSVGDSGPGVPPDMRDKVFERFRQLDDGASRRHGGTGLGLAIVKELVGLHRGTVSIGDAPEGGALFRVQLPLRAPDSEDVESGLPYVADGSGELFRQAIADLRRHAPPTGRTARGHRPLVLVVEDNPEMARFLAEGLGQDNDVEVATDGAAGLERALALRPDAIVTDVMMPEKTGEELLVELRQQPAHVDTPVLVLSARADEELRLRLLRRGAHDFVVKPFSLEELRVRVSNQTSIKRTRDLLQRELVSQSSDLETLAREVSSRKRELEGALASLRIAHEQVERAVEVKSEFLSLVSHELRTPLTSLLLNVEHLQHKHADRMAEPLRAYLVRVYDGTRRLSELVDQLLEYTRIEKGHVTVEIGPLPVRPVFEAVLEEHRSAAEQKGLELQMEVGEGVAEVRSDARMLRLVLSNLVGNAVKFTERGVVRLLATSEDGRPVLRVEDSGPGIAPRDIARIFEPFTHVEPLKGKHTPGFGLGLTLVRQMVGVMSGEISVESELGKGSTFLVKFPPVRRPTSNASAVTAETP